jgi:23S rRNA pseudouridine2457 synthase
MLILFNKPFNVLSQFTDKEGRRTLAEFISVAHGATLPPVRPAGRLDYDSEGLLLLTDDGGLQHRIADPKHKLPKTYWVQVEGIPDESALRKLRDGIVLDGQRTRPAGVHALAEPTLWPRDPPIRFRKLIPTAWIELIISEGRNRQVRRMTAAVGLPTLRLVRIAVGPYTLAGLAPGTWRAADAALVQLPHALETERGGGGADRARRKIPVGRGRGGRRARAQPTRRPSR